jgi:hypothetical protein
MNTLTRDLAHDPGRFPLTTRKPIIEQGKNMGRVARQDPLAQLAARGPPKSTRLV